MSMTHEFGPLNQTSPEALPKLTLVPDIEVADQAVEWQPKHEVPDITLGILQADLNAAADETSYRVGFEHPLFTESPELDPDDRIIWKDFVFDFSSQAMVGTDGIPTNRTARLRNAVNAVRSVAPQAIRTPDGVTPADALTNVQKRLKSTNKVGETTTPKDELLDPELVLDVLEQEMAYLNDPVYQAIMQLKQSYGQLLKPSDWKHLRSDILLSAKQLTVEQIYNEYVSRYKATLPTAEKVGRFLGRMRILI